MQRLGQHWSAEYRIQKTQFVAKTKGKPGIFRANSTREQKDELDLIIKRK